MGGSGQANVGPVFYIGADGAGPGHRLGMRYSARKKFISFRDAATRAAADLLFELINQKPLRPEASNSRPAKA